MKGKRVLCFLLALFLTASLIPSPAWAEGEAREIQVTIQTGMGTSAQASLSWEDGWFTQAPSQYQQGLAQASMALSAAAYSQDQGEELADALTGLGFEQVHLYHYGPEEEEAENQVAYAFGFKKLAGADKTLAAIVIQGTNGSAQWRSNFRIGEGNHHQGFALARDEMMEQLESYLAALPEDELLFFLTGHSRGAAVANLAADRLALELFRLAQLGAGRGENGGIEIKVGIADVKGPGAFRGNAHGSGNNVVLACSHTGEDAVPGNVLHFDFKTAGLCDFLDKRRVKAYRLLVVVQIFHRGEGAVCGNNVLFCSNSLGSNAEQEDCQQGKKEFFKHVNLRK